MRLISYGNYTEIKDYLCIAFQGGINSIPIKLISLFQSDYEYASIRF